MIGQCVVEVDESLDNIRTIYANREIGSCLEVPLQCSTPVEAKVLVEEALGEIEEWLSDFFNGHSAGTELKKQIEMTMEELVETIERKVDDVRQACQDLRAIAGNRGEILREIEREL